MAVDLNTEFKRWSMANDLPSDSGDETDTSDTTDETDSTDSTEQTDSGKEPAAAPEQPAPTPSRAEAGLVSLGDYSAQAVASPTPTPSAADRIGPVTHAIAEDQPVADYVPAPATVQPAQPETAPTQPATVPVGHIDLGPPGRNIYTDPDTGGRYVVDPNTGQMVPHAELATAADKAAQPPEGVVLPRREVTGVGWSPEEGLPVPQDQVRRAQLVKLPAAVQPAPDRLDQVERGELVKLPPGTAPRALPAGAPGTVQPVPITQGDVRQPQPSGPQAEQMPVRKGVPGQESVQMPAVVAPVGPPATQAPAADTVRGRAGLVSLGDYSQPKAAAQPPAAQQPPVTGALAQGPPGTHPAGTEDEPYWPQSAEQISQLPPGSRYVDPRDGSEKTAPGQPTAVAKPAAPGQVLAEPDIDIQSQSYTKGRTQEPSKLILHSTDGSSEKADVNTLTGAEPGHRVSVNYYVTKDGRVMHFVSENDTAWHAGADRYGGNGNAYTLGIEQQHVDGKEPWPDAQVRATAGVAAGILARHPNMTIDDVIGHSDLAGERKQDPVDYPWAKFRQYVAEAQGQQGTAAQAAAPSAQPVTKLKNGFYQDEKPGDFLTGKATTFATQDDIASGQDNGVGAPRLGRLDTTQVAGVAIPIEALQAKYGNNYAAWRTARVDVVDQATGKRLRVPIVDLGPRGDLSAIVDMTPTLSSYFGGDKNLSVKLVDHAGPDVNKNPQLFADEQAAIKNGVDSGSLQANRQVIGPQGPKFTSVAQTPEQAAAAQQAVQAAVQKQQDIVSALPEVKGGNVIDAYNRLDQGVDGVTPAYIKNAQANLKQEAITQVRQKYPEIKTDDDAWKVAQTPVWQSTAPITELGTAVYAGYTKADLAFNQMMQGADANRLTDFAKALHPDYKPEGLTAFVKSITDIQDPTQRSQMIGHLMASLPESTQSMFDSVALSDSADRVGNPEYQKAQSEALAAKRAYLDHLEMPDPRMKGGWLEKGAQLVGSVPAMASLWATGAFGQTLFASQIYVDTKDKLQAAHPDWSASQINDTTKNSTIAQLVPQGILATVGAGQLGRVGELLEQWTGGKINFGGISRAMAGVENPALRAVIGAAPHIATGAGAGAAQQIAGNIAEGRPAGEGVLGAAVGGAVMGAPAGIMHGIGAGLRPPERPAVVQPPPVEQRPARTEEPPLAAEESLRPPEPVAPTAEQQRPPIAGQSPTYDDIQKQIDAEEDRLEKSGVDTVKLYTSDIGPIEGWKQMPPNLEALYNQRDAIGAQELDESRNAITNALSTKGFSGAEIERILDYYAISQKSGAAEQYSASQYAQRIAAQSQTHQAEQLAYSLANQRKESFDELQDIAPQTLRDAATAVKAVHDYFSGAVREPQLPLYPIDQNGNPKVSESEPWVSQIANRFTAERMATGELGPVEPGVGVTKEEMLARGLKMPPETIAQHVSNVMNDVGGNPRDQAAAIRTEEARLSQVSHNASLLSEADPKNAQLRIDADNAFKDLSDFHNGPVAKLKNDWHAQGMTLQGEIPVDLSSYNGLRDAYLRDVGKAPPPEMEPVMRNVAKRVRAATDAESAAMRNLGAEIERQSARRRLPSDEELRQRIMERMKDMPCPS